MDKDFRSKPIKERGKIPHQHLKVVLNIKKSKQIAYWFTTVPIPSDPYIAYTVDNIDFIKTLNYEKKD